MGTLELAEAHETYVAHFLDREKNFGKGPGAWLLPIRKAALARFSELGFPDSRHEEWLYTSVAPIARTAFEPAGPGRVALADLKDQLIDDCVSARLVFVNGRFSQALSSLGNLPAGVKILDLGAALEQDPRLIEPHLARHASYQASAFTAMNTAFIEDGAVILVPRNCRVEGLIHVLFVTASSDSPAVTYPRVLLVAESGSEAAVVESYCGLTDGEYFTNAVTELVVGDNAVIDHYKIVREGPAACHVGDTTFRTARSSVLTSHTVSLGGVLVRNDFNALLDGEGCDCNLYGLTMIGDSQHVDNHLRVEHSRAHCNSREYFKGIYDDRSHGVFSGRINVHPGAQKTDAKQTNMNLLLSEEALVDTKPQLEIFADDVKCTHGATIGQIDDDAIFYLRSRGISADAARSLLIYAFANDSLSTMRAEPLRRQLHQLLLERLPHGELFQGVL